MFSATHKRERLEVYGPGKTDKLSPYYNEQRLHSSLDYRTPAEYHQCATVSPGVLSPQHPRQLNPVIPSSGDISPQVH